MDKCTKYINLFLFSLFQSCTQHFYYTQGKTYDKGIIVEGGVTILKL
jgi:hypothetical protein